MAFNPEIKHKIEHDSRESLEIEKNFVERIVLKYPFLILKDAQYFFTGALKKRLPRYLSFLNIYNWPLEIYRMHELGKDKLLKFFSELNNSTDFQLLCFRRLKETYPEIKLDDMENFKFEAVSIKSLSNEELMRLREIYSNNYDNKPALKDALLKSFDQVIRDEQGEENEPTFRRSFRIVRIKGEVVGFFFFEYEDNEDVVKFKSFNVDARFAGRGVGKESIEDALNRESESKLVKAQSLLGSGICSKYLEDFGFVGTSVVEFENEKILNIIRDDRHKGLLKSKDLPEKYLFEHAQLESVVEPEPGMKVMLCKSLDLDGVLNENLRRNCLLTRNIKYSTDEGEVLHLVVTEELSEEDYLVFMGHD